MRRDLDPALVRAALARRVRAAAEAALPADALERASAPGEDLGTLLTALVEQARAEDGSATSWLLRVALSGSLPNDAEVRATRRLVRSRRTQAAVDQLLAQALTSLIWSHPLAELEVLVGGVLVDVDFTAQHELNTGIQRVVRHTVPHWAAEHDVALVVWWPWEAMRRVTARESTRVLAWRRGPEPRRPEHPDHVRVVVPWRGTVLVPEVPPQRTCEPLAALAQHSGSTVGLIGYDCIPVVSADLMPPDEPERFVHYLTLVKHAHRVSAISRSAAQEFAGFAHMLPAQGLPGPVVTEALLATDPPPPARSGPAAPGRGATDRAPQEAGPHGPHDAAPDVPSVVVVGSHEPRKNHLAVLHAAEVLWREGLRFTLRFIGGSSWASEPFDATVHRLRAAGRPVTVERSVDDDGLWAAYRAARFSVFPSVHEGFGLPVVESLSVGTPVITSDLGSLAEVAEPGGALTVDPRDDRALTDAMRRLLTDDDLHAELVAQAAARPERGWIGYARDAWTQLVEGVEA